MVFSAIAACGALLLAPASAPQKKPAKKPAQKPAVGKPIVLGTKQLPGDFGKIGTTYTIGKDLPLNFTMIGLEYKLDRFIGDNGSGIEGWMPRKDEKLLVVKYTVQNPNNRDARLWYNTLSLIGITADGENINHLNRPIIGSGKKYQEVQLKPAQKVALTAVLRVPAEGELPKFMVQHRYEPQAAVIRYDLTGKVAKLKPEFSEDGYTAKESLAGGFGNWMPFSAYDLKVESFQPTTDPIPSLRSEPAHTQWIAKLTVKGLADQYNRFWYGNLNLTIKTEDGDLLQPRVQDRILRMSTDQPFDGQIPVGEEMSFRLVIDLPNKVQAKEFRLGYKRPDDLYRQYVISLTP